MRSQYALLAKLSLVAIAWHSADAAGAWLNVDGGKIGGGTKSASIAFIPVHQSRRCCSIINHHPRGAPARCNAPPPLQMVRAESSCRGASLDDCHVPRASKFPGRRRHRLLGRSTSCHVGGFSGGALYMSSPPRRRSASGGGTFVEGDDYGSSLEDEIEAMGGDVFFLDGYGSQQQQVGEEAASTSATSNSYEGGGLDVDEGWDGVVDDNAHFDFD